MLLGNSVFSPNEVIWCLIAGTAFLTGWMICRFLTLCGTHVYSKTELQAMTVEKHVEERGEFRALSWMGNICFLAALGIYICGGQLRLEQKPGTTRIVFDPLPITIESSPQKTPSR